MNKLHNLGAVMRFEIIRALKKPTFWLMALGFPVITGVVIGIVFLSNQATIDAAKQVQNQKFSMAVTDESGVIKSEALDGFDVKQIDNKSEGVKQVQDGVLDAYFYYPDDLAAERIEVYGKDVGLFDNGRYSAVANALLSSSVSGEVSDAQRAILQDSTTMSTVTFRDGKEYDGIKEMIIPGLFLVLFYLLIGFFGGQMLNSTVEEKENRTIEMLLTMVQPYALIVGKILSLIVLAILQTITILLPLIIIYLLAGSQIELPNVDLTDLPVNPLKIALGAIIFSLSFLLFTGILVAIGAAMPTAKEASQWFGLVVMFIFGPLYGVSAFISYPDSPFVTFLSLFPLTSPIPLLLRNAYGNLPLGEALLGAAILAVSAIIVLVFAVKIFRYGAMEYDSRLSLKALKSKRINN